MKGCPAKIRMARVTFQLLAIRLPLIQLGPPTGQQIAYDTCYPITNVNDCYFWEIGVVSATTGGSPTVIAGGVSYFASSPSWSPDGTKIAYLSGQTGTAEIWVMNPDGTGQSQITFNSTNYNDAPYWSQDGHYIIWLSDTPGPSAPPILNSIVYDGTLNTPVSYPNVILPTNGAGGNIDTTRCRRFDTLSGLPAN